ncbi:hypothetical protein C8F01DRAFT_1100110 [Mycena amicta]|nr:hypothetical protein C8F01DRAFT_1100110 [Mycena amicta]
MRPSSACLARKVPKPIKPKVQVFHRAQLLSTPTTPRILPRAKILNTSIHPAPAPRSPDSKPPTLLETLVSRQKAAPEEWPPNLRIEPVISRKTWDPVKKGIRSKLKKMLKEI